MSSSTPSERVSAVRVKAVERGWRVKGRVVIAVRRVEWARRRARRACRKVRKAVGWAEVGG